MAANIGTISGIPITGYCQIKGTDVFLPMMETQSDIQWVEGCIKDREEHPEKYPGEDIPAVIARQKVLLRRLREEERAKAGTSPALSGRGKQIVIELEGMEL